MNKEYQKPEVEIISLISMEAVSSVVEGEGAEGEMGLESNIFG